MLYLVALLEALPLARSDDDYEALLPWRVGASTDLAHCRSPPASHVVYCALTEQGYTKRKGAYYHH
jgi:hypothetical protein